MMLAMALSRLRKHIAFIKIWHSAGKNHMISGNVAKVKLDVVCFPFFQKEQFENSVTVHIKQCMNK